MKLLFSKSNKILTVYLDDGSNHSLPAFSEVRNELNGERPDPSRLPDIFHSSDGTVSMPRPFPNGIWSITGIQDTNETWLKPKKLITDANQWLDCWILNGDGKYGHNGLTKVRDWGYRIHYANGSHHTEGCIGLVQLGDLEWLASVCTSFPISLTVED